MSGREEDFTYFISLALENKLPWNSLETILNDWTPNLPKAKKLIEIMLKELQILHSKLQEKQIQSEKSSEDKILDDTPNTENSYITELDVQINGFDEVGVIESHDIETFVNKSSETDINIEYHSVEDETLEVDHLNKLKVNSKDNENEILQIDEAFSLNYISQKESQVIEQANSIPHGEKSQKPYSSLVVPKKDSKLRKRRYPSTDKKYTCPICQIVKDSIGALYNHNRIHKANRSHQCKTCNKEFSAARTLRDHENIHTGKKPYKCKTCPKGFSSKPNLIQHERYHGEKQQKCAICSMSFHHKAEMKNHERIHSGENPYYCETCGNSFKNSSSLKIHIRTHLTDILYDAAKMNFKK